MTLDAGTKNTIKAGRGTGTFAWIWLVVVMAALLTGAASWFTVYQNQVTRQYNLELGLVDQAQVDLLKGYLYVTVSGSSSGLTFDANQGMRLIDQSQAALEQVLQLHQDVFGHNSDSQTALDSLSALGNDMLAFRQALADWQAKVKPEAETGARLKITFYELEKNINETDYHLRQDLEDLNQRNTRLYSIFLGVAGSMLIVLFLALRVGMRARQRAEQELRESEARYRGQIGRAHV